jgi:DNA-binding response OmpR family regulator
MPRHRLLLVEPNAELRRVLREYLRRFDFEVLEAGDASEALQLARRERPELIISETVMEGADGLALARALRAEPDVRGLPLVLMGPSSSPEGRLHCIDSGADDYVLKPFSMRELTFRITRQLVLHRRSDPGELAGDLARFKCTDILQLLEANQATGVLQLEGPETGGEIHLLDGYICGGFSGELRGEDAVYPLIPLRRGRFHFGRINIRSNIESVRSTTEFIMEALRRQDETSREPVRTDPSE